VRRPAGPWTPTLHALLTHLAGKGFPSPKPLGVDERDREILTFLPGRATALPWPPVLLTLDGVRQVGALLRRYHDAVADFALPEPAVWMHGPQALAPGEIVIHGDFGPHNLIWDGDKLTGLIDFELARPGRWEEDALFALLRVAHQRPDEATSRKGFAGVPDRRGRVLAFAEAYGAPAERLMAHAVPVQAAELDRIERLGGAGLEPWATFLRKGLAEEARTELAWLEANSGRLL